MRPHRAIHLKLDELIRGVQHARNSLVDLENLSDEELDKLQDEFQRFRETAEKAHGRDKAPEPHAPHQHK